VERATCQLARSGRQPADLFILFWVGEEELSGKLPDRTGESPVPPETKSALMLFMVTVQLNRINQKVFGPCCG